MTTEKRAATDVPKSASESLVRDIENALPLLAQTCRELAKLCFRAKANPDASEYVQFQSDNARLQIQGLLVGLILWRDSLAKE